MPVVSWVLVFTVDTVSLALLATKAVLPSGVTATPPGPHPRARHPEHENAKNPPEPRHSLPPACCPHQLMSSLPVTGDTA